MLKRSLLIIGCLAIMVICTIAWTGRLKDYILLSRRGVTIQVTTDQPYEGATAVYCSAFMKGRLLFGKHLVGFANGEDLSFSIIETDGSTIALIENSNPNAVLALFDIDSFRRWPSGGTLLEDQSAADTLLRKVKQFHPGRQLTLSSEILDNHTHNVMR